VLVRPIAALVLRFVSLEHGNLVQLLVPPQKHVMEKITIAMVRPTKA